jgi:beta-glucanase (GH16 family)
MLVVSGMVGARPHHHLAICLGLAGLCLVHHAAADTGLNIPGYRITWHDEFEGAAVDPAKWKVNVGVNAAYRRASDGRVVEPHWFGDAFEPWTDVWPINGERQYYSPENVTVEDGRLRIRADRETVAEGDRVGWYDPGYHEYTSGKLNTAEQFPFRFGIVNIRAKLPEGPGLWPALWMLNAPDPWFWDDEIDIMEAKGSLPTRMSSAHHFKLPGGANTYNAAEVDAGVNLQTSFNEYTLQWEPTYLQTWVNNQPVLFDDEAVPQDPMFLIMNAAVGGMFDGLPTPDNPFPTFFEVDWVRVWQPASTPGDLASGGFEDFQGAQWANWNTLDDGNLSVYAAGALHGLHSVRIDRRNQQESAVTRGPNLFTDGTAGGWQGWLNQLNAAGEEISGGAEDPANIPATLGVDSAILPIHQSAPSLRANAVVFRQVAGGFAQGRTLTFSGVVAIEEPFPADASAVAFIRVFNADYSFSDVAAPVQAGGDFSLEAAIPGSGVPFVQIGLETTGATGSAGRLAAADLYLEEGGGEPPADEGDRTGFNQTVVVSPGQPLRFGVLAANHPADPLGPGAEGRMTLEFLDADLALISATATTIVDGWSGAAAMPYSLSATAPANAAFARLRIERITVDPETDHAGGFIADAAFLHAHGSTELPVVTAQPPATLTVNAGDAVDFSLQVSSASPVATQWYRDGVKVGIENSILNTNPASGGGYFAVVENAAGPVVGGAVELTVLDPDTDGDGISDYEERFITLTDPLDPLSTLRITGVVIAGNQLSLSFPSVDGVRYRIQGSPDLAEWQAVGPVHAASGGVSTLVEELPAAEPPLRFFRIQVIP